MIHNMFGSFGIVDAVAGLEEEMERVRKEKDQLDQEHDRMLESEWKVGEELKTRNQELTGKISFDKKSENSFIFIAPY